MATKDRFAKEWEKSPKPEAAKSDWQVELTSAASIKPTPIQWLWPGWLAAGKLTLLAGAGGSGKTTLAIGLIGTLTKGGRWPDGELCHEATDVLIWSAEDDPADTLIPRLMAAGADLSRVRIINGRTNAHGERQPFDPATDFDLLRKAMEGIDKVSLLLLDPLVSAVKGDMHRANDVRRALQQVVEFAGSHSCSVLGITHFSKGSRGTNPADRVIGSQAFGALARTVLVTAKDDDSETRVLARAKSNISTDLGGISYTVEPCTLNEELETTRVIWGELIEGNARQILSEAESNESQGHEQDDAEKFLQEFLSSGPVPTGQIKSAAASSGIAWRTVERAKKSLNIKATKIGMKEGWAWQLPTEDRQQRPKTATHFGGGLQEKVAAFGARTFDESDVEYF